MSLIRCLHIANNREAIHHMEKVGVDVTGLRLMQGKMLHLNLKVEGVDPKTANLIKQEMLSLGGDAAVDGRGLDCSAPLTDTLLMGTQKQVERLVTKLEQYPHLQSLDQSLKETLTHLSKRHYVIHCRSRAYTLGKQTLLMGILNVTPDSFSDGGLYFDKERAVDHGVRMAEEGADMIDVGGESTRPGAKPVGEEEELSRVIPVIEALSKKVKVPISIDTSHAEVAQKAAEAGAEIINDISGLRADPHLAEVAAREHMPLVLMHIRGTPETMQKDVHYDSLFSEILHSLRESVHRAESCGVEPNQIIVDPGIGFGKNLEHNLLILKNLSELRVLGKPILLGTSRKTFIGKILNTDVNERLEGTLSTIAIAVLHGAHIIRCHDVLPAKRAVAVADAIKLAGSGE